MHHAVIAAQQDGEAAGVERGIHGTGNVAGDRCDPLRIQDPGLRVAHAVVGRHVDTHRIRGAEALVEARPPRASGASSSSLGRSPSGDGTSMTCEIIAHLLNLRPRNCAERGSG